MARKDQPYLPLYIQDFLTDEKLIECSAESTGVYIRLLCVLHKQETYGRILLKQKDKQNESSIENFAKKIAKHMPYSYEIVLRSLVELYSEKVIQINDDELSQKRMIKDFDISEKRSKAGKHGGDKTQFAKAKIKAKGEAKCEANSENEDEDEIDIDNNTNNRIPYKKIMEKYNSSCGSLAKIKNISGDRKTHVEARVKEYGLESVYKTFEIAGQSDFLSGENDRGWKANFDWLMNTANMAKVLEGNYSKSKNGKPKNGDINEAGERYYDGKWYKL